LIGWVDQGRHDSAQRLHRDKRLDGHVGLRRTFGIIGSVVIA
jgi:hypothetical protein